MKVTVDEQAKRFYLAFDKWESAVGHEIKVGEYRFSVIPLSDGLNISEVTTGSKVLIVPISIGIMMMTETKEDSIKYFEKIGNYLKQFIERRNDFDTKLAEMKKTTFERLRKMPPIENVDIDCLVGE